MRVSFCARSAWSSDDALMTRRRSDRALEVKDSSREAVLETLLDHLCVTFGFSLPPDANEALRTDPPEGVDKFTDAVITAEGMDPVLLDTSLRRRMREMVEQEAGRIL
jgi:hypothetical protein